MKEKEAWEKARERYESAEIPEELSGVVSAALRGGNAPAGIPQGRPAGDGARHWRPAPASAYW